MYMLNGWWFLSSSGAYPLVFTVDDSDEEEENCSRKTLAVFSAVVVFSYLLKDECSYVISLYRMNMPRYCWKRSSP